jgi:hypothetical protein
VDVLFELYGDFVDEMLDFAKKSRGLAVSELFQLGALQDDAPE